VTIAETWGITPVLEMADGGTRRTIFMNHPSTSTQWFITSDLWKYDRSASARKLYIPDGTIATYEDSNRRLTQIRDAFGNTVSLTWGSGSLSVVQNLGNGESRAINFTLNSQSLPTTMTFNGHTWQVRYDNGTDAEPTSTVPPEGSGWTFAYTTVIGAERRLETVTTPHGGRVQYVFGQHFLNATDYELLLDYRRTYDRGSSTPLEWSITYVPNSSGYSGLTTVTTPSGPSGTSRRVKYTYGPVVTSNPQINPTLLIDGGVGLLNVDVEDLNAGGIVVQSEQRKYTRLAAVWWPEDKYSTRFDAAVPWQHIISRSSRTYTITFAYSADHYLSHLGDYHQPRQILETTSAEFQRTTDLTYFHRGDSQIDMRLATFYILGQVNQETVTVGTHTYRNSWRYDVATGFLDSATRDEITTTFTPDAYGNVSTMRTATGKVTSYTYSWGQVRDTRFPEPDSVIEREINVDGTIASETRGRYTTVFMYDNVSRLKETRPPGGTTYVFTDYDPAGTWVRTRRGTSILTTTLDGFGRPIQTIDSVNVQTRRTYDAEGRVTFDSYPFTTAERGTLIEYDALNRVIRQRNPGGTFNTRAYGAGTVTLTDEKNRQTVQTWKAFGHPDDALLTNATVTIDDVQRTWGYEYNAHGALTKVTAPDASTRTWTYERNRLASETHPESGLTTYTNDDAGVIKTKVDDKDTVFTYTFDGNDRLRAINAGSRAHRIAYEPGTDNRIWTSSGDVDSSFFYDAAGRLERREDVIDAHTFTTKFEYDNNDQLTAIVYPSQRRITYERNVHTEGRITKVSEPSAGRDYAFGFTYHPTGALMGYTAGNLVATTIAFDPDRYWVDRITATRSGTTLSELTYDDRDEIGNVRSIADVRSTGTPFSQTFTYDSVDRVITATSPDVISIYAYDVHGNRQTAGGTAYGYQTGTFRLITRGEVSYTHDDNGNVITATGASYIYTPHNLLESATVGATITTYAYDIDDWRAKKSISGSSSTYYIRGLTGELLSEWKDPGTPTGAIRDYIYAETRLLSTVDKSSSEDPGPPTTDPEYALVDESSSLDTGLIGLFVMDEGSGTFTTNRVSGEAATFAGTWPTWNPDPSLAFSGGSYLASYLNAAPGDPNFDALPVSQVTIAAKLYVTTLAAAGIVEKDDNGLIISDGIAFGWTSNGALRLSVGRAGQNLRVGTANGAITTGRWMQVAMTWDGTLGTTAGARLFIDGVEQSLTWLNEGSGTFNYNNARYQPFRIGTASAYDFGGTLNGKIAYVAVYKGRLLTGPELTTLNGALPLAAVGAVAITPNAAPMTVPATATSVLQFATTTRQVATVELSSNTM
jgi:YD repeat-containing protein